MIVKIAKQTSEDTIDIELESFDLTPSDDIDDDNVVQLLIYIESVEKKDPAVIDRIIEAIRSAMSLGEEEEWPEEEETLQLYMGEIEEHWTYFNIIGQMIEAKINGQNFQYNSARAAEDLSALQREEEEIEEENEEEEEEEKAKETEAYREADAIFQDTDINAEEEEEPSEEESEFEEPQEQQQGLEEEDNRRGHPPIPSAETIPPRQVTSQRIEKIASSRVRNSRSESTRMASGPPQIKSNFRPPEKPVSFARTEPPFPRTGLELRTVDYNGVKITFFTNKKTRQEEQ